MELLAAGEVDVALEPYVRPGPGIRRVLPDHHQVEAAYFARTAIFPIVHTLVLRAEVLDTHPWVGESLLDAFRQARARDHLYQSDVQKQESTWEQHVLGHDPFGYRLDTCARASFEALGRYLQADGLLDEPLSTDSLFALREA